VETNLTVAGMNLLHYRTPGVLKPDDRLHRRPYQYKRLFPSFFFPTQTTYTCDMCSVHQEDKRGDDMSSVIQISVREW
jgi:hypothetical protein